MERLLEDLGDGYIDGDRRMEENEESIRDETENQLNEDEEEEDECRVCRGPAEEGRPLLQPCKCSGSMGLVHQECLISWLEVTRGDGRCEICKTKFCFDPQYAENTPDRLPAFEVILGLSSRFLAKWLPLALRILFAAFLWLAVAPYSTNCLYLGWIIRPSSILSRQETILSDIVSGAVMGAIIIISFLSLMSFADFLRVLWQQPPVGQHPEGDERQEDGRENDTDGENNEDEADGNATDDRIIEFIEKKKKAINIEAVLNDEISTIIDKTTTRDLSVAQQKGEAQINNTDHGSGIGEENDSENRNVAGFDQIDEQLRDRAVILRDLAMEREARQQGDGGGRDLAQVNIQQVGRDVDQVAPLADDIINMPGREVGGVEEFDYESDDGDVDENEDDNKEAWIENDDDDEEDEALRPLPVDAGVAFDPGNGIGEENDSENQNVAGFDHIDEQLRDRAVILRDLAMEREARQQGDGGERDLAQVNIQQVGRDVDQVAPLADDIINMPGREVGGVEEFDYESDDGDVDENEDVDEEAWMDNDDDEDEDDALRPLPVDADVAFDPMDPVLQDDQVDMEINVALDELLGFRGPISTLVRNLLWLLAFNATYLGIFGFLPKAIGSMMYSRVFNTTLCDNMLKSIPYVSSEDQNRTTVISLLSSLEEESANRNTTFKLSDFSTVTLGYLSIACFIVLSRYTMIAVRKAGKNFENDSPNTGQNLNQAPELRRVHRGHNVLDERLGEAVNDMNDEEALVGIGESIEAVLDVTVAIIKVCVLLFMKMFLLPLSLGLWLDASTMRLFGHDVAGRLAFAGGDLFSFILLHWVAGITFMLLVTVFLLQLREVTHPDILARLIRPQEPQPDLLGNLMHETVLTHMKRMLLSLAIYAPLLTLHVTLPVMLFHASGLNSIFTFYELNFYHFLTPQLQIPLELITFHLSMLALLERHKNTIGGLQHYWMKFMCRRIGLTEHILPRRVKAFELVGTKPVFTSDDKLGDLKVDPFFSTLATKEKDIDEFIMLNIDKAVTRTPQPSSTILGEQQLNGERVLSIGVCSISLPADGIENKVFRVPTKIGRFRLRIKEDLLATEAAEEMKISIYSEIQGDEIKRPPEGWDDLGAGGAFVQGRWAWAKERKSLIEASVAERTPFRASSKECRSKILIAKVVILIFLSWFAVIFTGLAIFSFPLAVGRSFYYLLRIPPKYIHDPLAFCIGAGLFFPLVSLLTRSINAVDGSLYHRCRRWLGRFRRPPTKKVLIVLESFLLWIAVAPLALGLSYEFVVIKSPKWFLGEENFLDWKTCAISWFMGTVFLNTWSFLLYFKLFTRQFWSNVGNGILEPPLNEDGNPNPNARNNGREDGNIEIGLGWQGKHGRVARFFKIWKSVLLNWDWDSVDRTILIDEFTRPTTKEIASTLVGSLLSYQLTEYAFVALFKLKQGGFVFPILGFVELGVFRKFLFRFCMAVHILFQIGSRSRSSIDHWFEAAHEAARDDRYLIGELLMNYNPETHFH